MTGPDYDVCNVKLHFDPASDWDFTLSSACMVIPFNLLTQ